MTKLTGFFACVVIMIFAPAISFSQYILNGNAKQESCNCYLLTEETTFQGGSVWQQTKINLNEPFDFAFNVFLGCDDVNGADGIVFMLQPVSTSLGTSGGGMGFEGVTPSIGIVLDTWKNTEDNDPAYDHITIQANGVIDHGNDLAGPLAISSTNNDVEDCKWHVLRINWDPLTKTLSTYFDGVFRLSTQANLVKDIFKNDPMVYWGFSAATGGKFNKQKFCTALNPVYQSNLPGDAICLGSPVIFKDNSTSFTDIKSYFWDFGDGSTSNLANPPPHLFASPGIYEVKHTITAADGCKSEPFSRMISIGDDPQIAFNLFDTCETFSPRLTIDTSLKVGALQKWNWQIDGTFFSDKVLPDFSKLLPGNYTVALDVVSNIGCASNTTTDQVIIENNPSISFSFKDACMGEAVIFKGTQNDNNTTINKWLWDFGDYFSSQAKDTVHVYNATGTYPVKLLGIADNGCQSFLTKDILINSAEANAGNDTIVIKDSPFQLTGSGGAQYSWLPTTGLSNPYIASPMGSVSDDITYNLTVKTIEGCEDTASIKITVFKGSGIYVPTAFSPNSDGLNDDLKPYYISIKSLDFFTIFDRWGKKVFTTNDMARGWDGFSNGRMFETGVYVWVLNATDVIGKNYHLNGSFVLIK